MYLAEGEPKGSQIFVRWVDADGPATQITHITETPRNARWSPDGKSIAFSMFVPDAGEVDDFSMPAEPKGAQMDAGAARRRAPCTTGRIGVGYLEDGYTHLFVVPADGGTRARADARASGASAPASCAAARRSTGRPTASRLSSTAIGRPTPTCNTSRRSSTSSTSRPATIRDLVTKPATGAARSVSPDGRTVAFTGYPPTGRSHTVSDLFVIPLTGGGSDMRKISGDFDRDPINLRWAPDGSGLYFDADDRGARNMQFASIVGGVKPITTGRHMLSFDSVSKDLVAAGHRCRISITRRTS